MTIKKHTKIKSSIDKVSKYHSSLLNLGLSSNEAKIYLYLLERGEPVGGTKIASGTGIHRQYVYIILPKLIQQGLVEEVITGKRAKYVALNPNKLTKIARAKVYEAEAVAEELVLLSKVGHQQESEVLFGVRELIEHEYEFEVGADFEETQYVIGGNAQAFIRA